MHQHMYGEYHDVFIPNNRTHFYNNKNFWSQPWMGKLQNSLRLEGPTSYPHSTD